MLNIVVHAGVGGGGGGESGCFYFCNDNELGVRRSHQTTSTNFTGSAMVDEPMQGDACVIFCRVKHESLVLGSNMSLVVLVLLVVLDKYTDCRSFSMRRAHT